MGTAIPRSVDALVLACLEKDPDRRPQSALELSERLAACEGADDWSSAQAGLWWQAHLPGLEADLAPASDAATKV
jgi:serine/threonine-protein kinase